MQQQDPQLIVEAIKCFDKILEKYEIYHKSYAPIMNDFASKQGNQVIE